MTGDVIRSRHLSAAQHKSVNSRLKALSIKFGELHPGSMVGETDIFRGDSWQCCLKQPYLVVTAAVFFRAGLKADDLDSRIGLGIGTVETLNPKKISESTGPAFVASGRSLDSLEKGRNMGLVVSDEKDADSKRYLTDLVIPLLDAQITRWTQREAVAVFGSMHGLTQQEIADWPPAKAEHGGQPTRQAIQDALTRSEWTGLVESLLKKLEKLLKAEEWK